MAFGFLKKIAAAITGGGKGKPPAKGGDAQKKKRRRGVRIAGVVVTLEIVSILDHHRHATDGYGGPCGVGFLVRVRGAEGDMLCERLAVAVEARGLDAAVHPAASAREAYAAHLARFAEIEFHTDGFLVPPPSAGGIDLAVGQALHTLPRQRLAVNHRDTLGIDDTTDDKRNRHRKHCSVSCSHFACSAQRANFTHTKSSFSGMVTARRAPSNAALPRPPITDAAFSRQSPKIGARSSVKSSDAFSSLNSSA